MKNLFFKEQGGSTVQYKSDKHWDCMTFDSPEHLVRRLNDLLLSYWECTPFSKEKPIPTILMSINDDETANFSYIDGKLEDPESVEGCSCFYTVDHDGMAHVKEFNEVLNLKNLPHMTAVVATIIRDVYGEFNLQKAGQQFLSKLVEESKA